MANKNSQKGKHSKNMSKVKKGMNNSTRPVKTGKNESSSKDKFDRKRNLRAQEQNPANYVNKVMGSTNDFSWYNKNPGIIEDASKISFFNQLGAKVGNFATAQKDDVVVPGIMAFDAVTGPGTSFNSTSGASLAGLSTYDAIRRELNKPNPDYEAQDVMMYLLACDDIFCQYINILRAFGIVHTWSGENLYTPKAYMKAFYGWTSGDFTEFITNEANYRATMNMMILKAASFLFYPTDFTVTDRHAWLFGNIFMDHDSNKAQAYGFVKHNNWLFDETSSDQGTMLIYDVPLNQRMSTMIEKFSESIERLRSSTLVRTLVADMRQAFGDANLLQMGRIDETYSITPTYDQTALMQIENMDVFFGWGDVEGNWFDSLNVKQNVDKNILLWTPFLDPLLDEEFIQYLSVDRVINIHTDDTSPAVVAEATRMMAPIIEYQFESEPGVFNNGFVPIIASDVIVDVHYCVDPTGEFEMSKLRTLVRSSASVTTLHDWIQKDLFAWASFDWAPKLWYIIPAEGTQGPRVLPILEWDNYTVIGAGTDNNSVLARLNTACNLSMWSVPQWGTYKV